jgi:IclR family acetate operon transcriptional repressor
MTTQNLYIVKPVYKAVQLLQSLADAQTDLSLANICKRTKLPKTTAYKYLQTFVACGYVAYDLDSESYRLGMRLFELGRLANKQANLQRVALPLMIALRDKFDESVNLAVLDGNDILCIESVNSAQSLRMQTPPGTREAVHATSLGKAMLAFLDEAAWDKHLRGPLKAHTTRTLTQLISIKAELRKTRGRGYAIDNQETTDGAYCVGAPIFNTQGKVEAGISISAPISRMNTRREKEFGRAVMATAAEISKLF